MEKTDRTLRDDGGDIPPGQAPDGDAGQNLLPGVTKKGTYGNRIRQEQETSRLSDRETLPEAV